MKVVATDSQMEALVVPGIQMQVGNQEHKWVVYVAPVADTCILGLDFLLHKGCVVDLEKDTVRIGRELIQHRKRSPGQARREEYREYSTDSTAGQSQYVGKPRKGYSGGDGHSPREDRHGNGVRPETRPDRIRD